MNQKNIWQGAALASVCLVASLNWSCDQQPVEPETITDYQTNYVYYTNDGVVTTLVYRTTPITNGTNQHFITYTNRFFAHVLGFWDDGSGGGLTLTSNTYAYTNGGFWYHGTIHHRATNWIVIKIDNHSSATNVATSNANLVWTKFHWYGDYLWTGTNTNPAAGDRLYCTEIYPGTNSQANAANLSLGGAFYSGYIR